MKEPSAPSGGKRIAKQGFASITPKKETFKETPVLLETAETLEKY